MPRRFLFALVVALSFSCVSARAESPVHALAMHGAPKYGPDFTHFDYVNPDAPKGGQIRLASVGGGFDSLNPFILKGSPAAGLGMTFQTLLESTEDEAFTEYGLLAQSIEMPEDRSWVVFNLRPQARWHDGKPVTAEDVVWTFKTLMTDGSPFYKAYYSNVKDAAAESPTRVKFTFDMAGNRELPLIVGQLPVLPKHFWEGRKFSETTLEPTLGSGPYRIKSVDPGRSIVYERVKDWWGADMPINKGRYNFDTIRYDYYLDASVALQALLAGEYDFRQENIAKEWATAYDSPAVREGKLIKEERQHDIPAGMQAFAFNTRREMFRDPRVRQALAYAFDFDWSNKQFAYGAYRRTRSYFENSEMASYDALPQGEELEILEKYRGKIPDEVFTKIYEPPKTAGDGNIRANLREAIRLLEEAGWKLNDKGLRVNAKGQELKFEIVNNSDSFERWVLPFIGNLKKIGVTATYRVVDTAQYQNRMDNFDFDMTINVFPQSLSPGNEQRDFWGSDKAAVTGSRNIIGIKDPVVDDLVKMIIAAPDRESLVARCRALDRVLLWGHYVIPHWHINYFRLAYWDKFGIPKNPPPYGLGIPDTWWAKQ